MAKNRVIIELSPARLQLAVVRGRNIVAMQAARLSTSAQADRNQLDLAASQGILAAMVKELGVAGAEATVLYDNATATSGVFSCAKSAGADAAAEAARLALADSAEFNLDLSPFDLIRLCADEPLKSDSASAEIVAQTHTVGIADTDRAISELFGWVSQAGLLPAAALPMNAVGLGECVEAAISSSRVESKAVAVVLHIGEHSSLLAGATHGRLRFVRQISLGLEALVDAVMSAAREASIPLTASEAADTLALEGIPQRTQNIGPCGQLTGSMVLPLIQPVLQRLVVELKQSLRFGVDASEREHVHLTALGAGANVPRLVSVIAEQCGVTGIQEPSGAAGTPAQPSVTETWLRSSMAGLGLLPRQLTNQVESGRLRHAIWVGAAATAMLIGADAWSTSLDLAQQERNIEQLQSRLKAAQPAAEMNQRLQAIQGALAAATAAKDARYRSLPDGTSILAMLATHTPASIKLMHVQILSEDQIPVCHVSGRATSLSGVDPDATVRAYIDSLSEVPLVANCRIGGTRRGAAADGSPMQTFDLALRLVEIPVDGRPMASAASKEVDK